MRGQWFGSFKGDNEGTVTIELDDLGDHYDGMAYVFSRAPGVPGVAGRIRTKDKSRSFALQIPIEIITSNGTIVPWDAVKDNYKGAPFDPLLTTIWSFEPGIGLEIQFHSASAGKGTANLLLSDGGRPPERQPLSTVNDWASFKRYALERDPARYVYRGQESNTWRLRTFFHRSGRSDLMRFIRSDINQLHAHLSSLTEHHFNLKDELEYAAFCNLVQHHGYPTPLLDWTRSPFIAAYFAFRRRRADDGNARIFIFDRREWQKDVARSHLVTATLPHFSLLDPLAIENRRMVPQQALSTVTNVDDIEEFIKFIETRNGKTYLEVIDLPLSERPQIIQELQLMGITAGSMFPGFDGACEQLREINFNI
ncbi:hypothetical protein BRADO3625 [Bradyrhizobium sp. ORS 278]|uniref:FRG domain-containing protein n=1 Tax=Bradyrhizobium sp. (strain ORS 278) TaxID=114615 RepID=UPI0001508E55|nr:FRG domain-containing protein [Bradyrhizobium sp. ORS 278]CAL77402.1 hypothetical protein BRADO3625 [Bradyrhizobium sp. ORS 278]